MSRIAILIPAHNEAESLAKVLRQIPSEIDGNKVTQIVVDDCSTDGTGEIACRFTSHVINSDWGNNDHWAGYYAAKKIIRRMLLKKKKGNGVGITTRKGFEYIISLGKFDWLIKLDGDGQHDTRFLPQVVRSLKEGSDLVICSRFHPLSDQTYTPFDRSLLNSTCTEWVKKITNWKLTDVRSGYMGFRMDLIEQITSRMIVMGYGAPMEILIRIWDKEPHVKITEIPHPAIYGGEGFSHRLTEKYKKERIKDQAIRLQQAYIALLAVLDDLNIPRETILRENGHQKSREVALGL